VNLKQVKQGVERQMSLVLVARVTIFGFYMAMCP